jgi:hypothetical protein
VITPTIAYGKGFGNFDLQGTFGVGLPTADTNLLGRNYAWNNTFQYRIFRKLWPEVELNSTFLSGGKERRPETELCDAGTGNGTLSPVAESGIYVWRRIPDRHDALPYD